MPKGLNHKQCGVASGVFFHATMPRFASAGLTLSLEVTDRASKSHSLGCFYAQLCRTLNDRKIVLHKVIMLLLVTARVSNICHIF